MIEERALLAVVAGEVTVDLPPIGVDAGEVGEGVVGEEVHNRSHCRHMAIVCSARQCLQDRKLL